MKNIKKLEERAKEYLKERGMQGGIGGSLIPGSENEFTSWIYEVKHKKKVIHDGFMTGPFYKTEADARMGFINNLNPITGCAV